jgi:GTP-binding protein
MTGIAKYLKSALLAKDYPPGKRPEVALAGRSNSGKSSFLNAIAKGKVAHVSSTPGKTRLLNFFDFGAHYRVVDMPGYGFASRSMKEMQEWTASIETYIHTRELLAGLILLMDIRRDWTEDEQMLSDFLSAVDRPMLIVLTKADQVTRNEMTKKIKQIEKAAQREPVFAVSALKKTGVEDVEEYVFKNWIKPFTLSSSKKAEKRDGAKE